MNVRPGPLVTVAGVTLRRVTGPRPVIRTDRSGMLVLALPDDATEQEARDMVLRHYAAVYRWVTCREAANAWAPIVKELVGGEGFPLGGRSHRMRWQQPTAAHAAAFEPTEHGVWLKVDPALREGPDVAASAIIDCYRRETIDVVRRRFGEYAVRTGAGPLASVAVTDDDARWIGLRAGRSGLTVTAHWALAQFGVSSIDYLICRVLCARAKRDIRAVFPDPYAARRMHDEARDVWTGNIAP